MPRSRSSVKVHVSPARDRCPGQGQLFQAPGYRKWHQTRRRRSRVRVWGSVGRLRPNPLWNGMLSCVAYMLPPPPRRLTVGTFGSSSPWWAQKGGRTPSPLLHNLSVADCVYCSAGLDCVFCVCIDAELKCTWVGLLAADQDLRSSNSQDRAGDAALVLDSRWQLPHQCVAGQALREAVAGWSVHAVTGRMDTHAGAQAPVSAEEKARGHGGRAS